MATHDDLGKLYLTQKSLSEWLHDIAHEDTTELRYEDNEKRERLRVLKEIIGIPFDTPVQFAATDIANHSPEHEAYLHEHGSELCALRLIPLDKSLPKLRMRGKTVKDVQQWFTDQKIDPEKYRAEYIPHSDEQTWSTIFVVTDKGIFGEIIRGRHNQLTQGLYEKDHEPRTFSYDFSSWSMSPQDDTALETIQDIVGRLKTTSDQQTRIKERLDATFTHDYLKGYFETTQCEEFGLWFVDYAPKLGERFSDIEMPKQRNDSGIVSGQVACKGHAEGTVVVLTADTTLSVEDFPDKAVLVCNMTTPDLVPHMQKAAAIVTDQGGILSHAAIVARELRIPCIVGTKTATKMLADGMNVIVDADKGVVHQAGLSE
jgi:phosphohistidine swiveling domain-containing protein